MKKIFTLIVSLLLCSSAWAQVVLMDEAGKVYGDGETMVLHSFVDEWDDVVLPCPMLKNTGSQSANIQLECTIVSLPEGTKINECLSGGCTAYYSGSFSTKSVAIAAGKEMESQIEWATWSNATKTNVEGTAEITMTLKENGVKKATITVQFVHGSTTGIAKSITCEPTRSAKYVQQGKLCIEQNGRLFRIDGVKL